MVECGASYTIAWHTIILSFFAVNPGMEHSDSDSFPENIRQGFANRVPADPSRSNSLMSETSSQPDIHPFFKVSVIDCEK